eukprot:948941-Pelagomonas_calceolata.AAC.1
MAPCIACQQCFKRKCAVTVPPCKSKSISGCTRGGMEGVEGQGTVESLPEVHQLCHWLPSMLSLAWDKNKKQSSSYCICNGRQLQRCAGTMDLVSKKCRDALGQFHGACLLEAAIRPECLTAASRRHTPAAMPRCPLSGT